MNKKILYVIGLVVVIILGVLFARILSGSIDARPASSSKVKNSNKLTNNQVKNETNNNTKNEVKNELNNNENTNTTTNEPKEETPKTDLEKAIDIVKKDWGADNTVYFAQDGQKESGEYIICVRDTETTSAKAWYTVNVQTGTFVKE